MVLSNIIITTRTGFPENNSGPRYHNDAFDNTAGPIAIGINTYGGDNRNG